MPNHWHMVLQPRADGDLARGNESQKKLLSPWPVPEPGRYLEWVNRSQPKEEIENIRYALRRNRPYGSETWVSHAVARFGLQNTIRSPGRPRNGT